MLGLEGYTVKSAYFTDNARTIVEVMWEHETEKDEVEVLVASIDKDGMSVSGGAAWNNLLKYISIEELHTNTSNYIRTQRLAFEKQIIAIGKKEGLYESTKKSDMHDLLIDCIENHNEDKEFLFKLKLKMFDMTIVKQSADRSLKAQLRKAQTLTTVLTTYHNFTD